MISLPSLYLPHHPCSSKNFHTFLTMIEEKYVKCHQNTLTPLKYFHGIIKILFYIIYDSNCSLANKNAKLDRLKQISRRQVWRLPYTSLKKVPKLIIQRSYSWVVFWSPLQQFAKYQERSIQAKMPSPLLSFVWDISSFGTLMGVICNLAKANYLHCMKFWI